jgi:hypothetical protein
MRRLVRGAGRLDWDLGTDPGWDGPNDAGAPLRLLDVAALLGLPGLRVWLTPRTLDVARRKAHRRVRVDVQRLGGFDGDVTLGMQRLPAAVAAARLAPATLAMGDLGGRLTLSLEGDAPEGRYRPRVTASGGPHERGRAFALRVDRSGPIIGTLRLAVNGKSASGGRSTPVRVTWSVADALGKVGRTALQRRVGNGAWREVAAGKSLEKARTSVRAGQRTALRVVSRDDLGNTSRSRRRSLHLSIRDSSSIRWSSSGGWSTASSGGAIGGSLLTTRSRSGSLTTEIEGAAYAIVAPVGPRRGSLRIRMDGGPWRTVQLRAKRSHARRIVHRGSLGRGTHTLEVRVGSGIAAVDALLLIR